MEEETVYGIDDLELTLIDALGDFAANSMVTKDEIHQAVICFEILKWITEQKENTTTENSDVNCTIIGSGIIQTSDEILIHINR